MSINCIQTQRGHYKTDLKYENSSSLDGKNLESAKKNLFEQFNNISPDKDPLTTNDSPQRQLF